MCNEGREVYALQPLGTGTNDFQGKHVLLSLLTMAQVSLCCISNKVRS